MKRGMLLVLTDVGADDESEFNRWYDREHMRERVEVPGFLTARRYRAEVAARRYCAIYETESLDVFGSDVYRQKLAAQSEWSRNVLKLFIDAHRSVGLARLIHGYGYGAALGLLRVVATSAEALRSLDTWIEEIAETPGVVALRLFESEPQFSGPVKEYRPTTRPIMGPDGRLLLIDASDPGTLEALPPLPRTTDSGPVLESLGVYSLTWGLARTDVSQSAPHA